MFSYFKNLKILYFLIKSVILFLMLIFVMSDAYGNGSDTLAPSSSAGVVKITRSWVLPAVLRDISAITITPSGKIACLQSEVGTIYIFNLETGSIDREIPFGPPGDYEGLALVNTTAYVACADGRILEIENFATDSPKVTEHGTHLTVEENVNGLCYDRRNKRLLVAIKGTGDANQQYKGIYAFNIAQKRMPVKPVMRIDLKSRAFINVQTKNVQMVFQPSDLSINPLNGQIYLIDGTRRQLLRMSRAESVRDVIELNREDFFQPEGITFTPSGELFIASKGDREEPGKLLQVRLR